MMEKEEIENNAKKGNIQQWKKGNKKVKKWEIDNKAKQGSKQK